MMHAKDPIALRSLEDSEMTWTTGTCFLLLANEGLQRVIGFSEFLN